MRKQSGQVERSAASRSATSPSVERKALPLTLAAFLLASSLTILPITPIAQRSEGSAACAAGSGGQSHDAAQGKLLMFDKAATDDEGRKAMGMPPSRAEKIPCMVWVESKPKAVMLLIHGFGLHKGTYDAFAKQMADRGLACYAIDVRGFGSWVKKGKDRIDFDSTMTDIGLTLNEIRRYHPGLPVIVLGESMGGAIAMKTAAEYPDLVDGLISAVPAGDRFDQANSEIGVVKHVIMHGFNKPMNVGPAVVNKATKKENLRDTWLNDPLARTEVTPNELMTFNEFMNETFDMAPKIKEMPVLFVQGSNDKLVRPAGTWKLFRSLATPKRQLVFSKSAEHLIFEDGQFSPEDLKFVTNWINRNIESLNEHQVARTHKKEEPSTVAKANGADSGNGGKKPAATHGQVRAMAETLGSGATAEVQGGDSTIATGKIPASGASSSSSSSTSTTRASSSSGADESTSSSDAGTTEPSQNGGEKTKVASRPASTTKKTETAGSEKAESAVGQKTAISYWIELKRDGKIFRCNNKTSFKSGDAIKFHIVPQTDGYAYIVLKQGSTGNSAILFPSEDTGQNNFLRKGQDYPLPYADWLAFDENPGLEKVSILFSSKPIDTKKVKQQSEKSLVAYVSADMTGAKDLIPTRMQLAWDDTNPIIMPDEISAGTLASRTSSSQVRLVADTPSGTLAVDIALLHK